jgi:hypothetical protein
MSSCPGENEKEGGKEVANAGPVAVIVEIEVVAEDQAADK